MPTNYCLGCGPQYATDSAVGQVSLAGEAFSIFDPTTCPNQVGVIDLTSQTAQLKIGSTYTISAAIITCSGSYALAGGAWIDYNRDGIWDTTSTSIETIFWATNYGNNTIGFTVPATAALGLTRMRVQVQEYGTVSSYNICFSFSWGGTKDFAIEIISAGASYCTAVGPTSTKDAALGPVSLAGESTSIIDNTGCPSQVGLHDLTNLVADLRVQEQYVISTQFITCGGLYNIYGGVWIDWDGNGQWSTSELLYTSSSFGAQTVSFFVPKNAKVGTTRMRVQVQETDDPSKYDMCSMFSYGGTKDFGINILPATAAFMNTTAVVN